MSYLNSQYNLDDINLNKSSLNLKNNYYERKVKEGIPIFQDINLFSRTANGQEFVDPFKLLENNKNSNYLNNGGQSSSLGIGQLSSNINISDIETRKIIEREMNPYLLQMKNELNIIMEKFRKEMEDKSNILNEISSLKDQISHDKQYNEDNYSNIEKKILNISNILNIQDKKINDHRNDIIQINKFNKDMNQRTDEVFQNLNDLEKIKVKVMSLDASNENVYKEICQNIEKSLSYKFDQLEKNINLIKGENSSIKRDISQNNMKLGFLDSENDKRDKKISELETNMHNLTNQINNINLNNNNNLNLLNNFEIKNNEFQQILKSINDKIALMNNNINSTSLDVKSQKQSINSCIQKNSEIENSINLLRNERQSFNNKLLELNLKIDSQAEKISKNNSILNDAISSNNSTLYKDLVTQISKSKDLIENLKDNYDIEFEKLRGEINQFDQIIKNNPFLNMSENERITYQFKLEQTKSNETFKSQILLLTKEIEKLKNINPSDRNNFIKIENNFNKIDKVLSSNKKDLKTLEEMMKIYADICKDLSEKLDKYKREVKNDRNNASGKVVSPIPGGLKVEELEEKVRKYINNNKEDITNIKIDIKEMNEKTIPQIYDYIDSKINQINNKISNNIINNNLEQKPNNYISDLNNNNSVNQSNNFIFNKNMVNISNNIPSPKISGNNNKISDNIIANDNFNNNNNKNNNIDDIANKIELMGAQENNNNDKEQNNSNWSISNKEKQINRKVSLSDKINDSGSIDKLIEDAMNIKENSKSKREDDFEEDFDK